jgi:tRNA pseudouridine55 synthase
MPRAADPRKRDGVLIVHKPTGPTSHDVVLCARRSLGVSRIGHTGTLDPQAAGVLPLVIGQATRLAAHLTKSDKEYVATIRFGIETDTHDASGATVRESGLGPSVGDLDAVLHRFEGAITQTPPLYSAKLVGGERSYVRARSGKPMQPAPVRVTAHRLELLAYDETRATIRIRCSAGFYVRSLAHDLGQALGVGAILDGLERTEAAGFTLSQAVPFSTLVTAPRAELWSAVKPTETLLSDIPPASLTAEGVRWARHGRELGPHELSTPLPTIPDLVRMLAPDGRMIGLAERSKRPGFLHPAVVFS